MGKALQLHSNIQRMEEEQAHFLHGALGGRIRAKARRDPEEPVVQLQETLLPAMPCSGPPRKTVSSLPMKRLGRTSLHLLPGLQASATRKQYAWS